MHTSYKYGFSLIFSVSLFLGSVMPTFASVGSWAIVGSINVPRQSHTATRLLDGRVLVVGGDSGNGSISSAELYDPTTGVWTPTASMLTPRSGHTATLLPDGKVLVVGGFGTNWWLSSAELYDPTTGDWTPAGSMTVNRIKHTATILSNGKVLVVGGYSGDSGYIASAETYDPNTGMWQSAGSMNRGRIGHTAVALSNGEVLVAGNASNPFQSVTAELYNPTTNSWASTGSMNGSHYDHTATLLPNGNVLVVGGRDAFNSSNGLLSTTTELYDPQSRIWFVASPLTQARSEHTATLLEDGRVLLSGGIAGLDNNGHSIFLASTEVYDYEMNTWSIGGAMNEVRANHTATLLVNGDVMVAGGNHDEVFNLTSSTEVYSSAVNNLPILSPIGNKTVNEGELLEFTLTATDPDGDTLTYSAANLPAGATFDSQTATFSWTPAFNQAGNYEDIEFTVTDDGDPMELDVELITITVGNTNRAPIFDIIGSKEVLEDEQLTFTVSATDPDNDAITLSATNTPAGSSFDPQTGIFSWTPTLMQAGNYVVTFLATDNGTPNLTGTTEVVITVGDNPTPTEQAEDLVEEVIDIALPTNIENSYLANLKKVEKFIEDGKITPAINQLNAFISKVEDDYLAGDLTQTERDTLVALAEALIADLE